MLPLGAFFLANHRTVGGGVQWQFGMYSYKQMNGECRVYVDYISYQTSCLSMVVPIAQIFFVKSIHVVGNRSRDI
jgi:hypothetical protein